MALPGAGLLVALLLALTLRPAVLRAQEAGAGSRATQSESALEAALQPPHGGAENEEKRPERIPIPGLQIGMGILDVDLRAPALDVRLKGGSPTQTGALFFVDWVGRYLRLGYQRQFYRNDLPTGTTLDGAAVDAISFDSNQFWAFGGLRPVRPLYLGLGLGWERRRVRVLQSGTALRDEPESRFMGGLLVDWAFGPPFSLQIRAFEDLRPGFVNVRAGSLVLGFTSDF